MRQLAIVEKFRKWLEDRHVKECIQCRGKEKVVLTDYDAYACRNFKEFYEETHNG